MNKFIVATILCVICISGFSGSEFKSIDNVKHFNELVLSEKQLVVVDFYADWCPSCKVVMKSLKEVSQKNDKAVYVKVDFSKLQGLAKDHAVVSVPTVLFFKDRKVVYRLDNLCSTKDYLTVTQDLVEKGKVRDDFVPENYSSNIGVSTAEAKKMIDESEPVVLDVRSGSEFARGHLENAVHIPVSHLRSRIDELVKHTKDNIIIYCYSGYRSSKACDLLSEKGFKVFNLAGGISSWQRAGFKIVK